MLLPPIVHFSAHTAAVKMMCVESIIVRVLMHDMFVVGGKIDKSKDWCCCCVCCSPVCVELVSNCRLQRIYFCVGFLFLRHTGSSSWLAFSRSPHTLLSKVDALHIHVRERMNVKRTDKQHRRMLLLLYVTSCICTAAVRNHLFLCIYNSRYSSNNA